MRGNFKKLVKLGTITMAVLLILAACGNGTNSGEKVLNIARETATNTINYIYNETANNSQVISNFSEGLTTYDKDGELVGGLAESWTHNGPVYTFKLREGLKWSDDTPLTAHDFVFGWQTVVADSEAPYRFFMNDIQNGADIIAGTKPATDLGVKALDDTTLEVTLSQERSYILQMLGFGVFNPLNEAFYQKVGADNFATSPDTVLASGAFKLEEYNPDSGYTLVKNHNYWNAANVKLDRINTRVVREATTQETLYANGELDVLNVTADLYDKYAGNPGLGEYPTARIYYFYMSGNTKTPAPTLANHNFRQAIAHAIDKKMLAENVFKDGSMALDYLVPQNFGDVNGQTYREFTGESSQLRFNVDRAREYLEAAKSELSAGDLNFSIAFPETPVNRRVFESVQGQIQTNLPGVNVSLEAIPAQTYFNGLSNGQTPGAYSGWAPDYSDVATYFQNFVSTNSLNFSKYNNPEFDALYKRAQAEVDVAKRAELFKQAEKILLNDGAIVPLVQKGVTYLVNEKVEGFNFNSISPEVDFRFISIK